MYTTLNCNHVDIQYSSYDVELRKTLIYAVTVGGWVACRVTGHYHNRRLVAWEPFIEPWTANVCFGIDLVEACRWKPITKQEANISRTATESSLLEISENGPLLTVGATIAIGQRTAHFVAYRNGTGRVTFLQSSFFVHCNPDRFAILHSNLDEDIFVLPTTL